MNANLAVTRKHSGISYNAMIIGIVCFFITFVQPTRIVMIGSLTGDYVTYGFTALGLICSIIGLSKKTEKNILPIISLSLSLSFPVFFALWLFLIITGVWDFAP